ncbi:unnamed protein product [Clonostachys rosea f. rosea IK726]|uniref:ADF-H domain-containing protein n=2 Tax=Bionectria ochroleuca TaxID=29856 RepID=A0A0B7JVS4_BIOOC|nr:unnamed protein product [Clonostachys rosea f. rosea IK726]
MSLNGLDDPKVAEAYVAASAEPGGWFLLKYASRDEVELLSSGTGGVAEMRGAVTAYDETNPLYGFLKYRRRNVLVKYLPEGCSRLIQARVAVHFNAVCERFSPYDSQFDMTTAEDLADAKLSPACSLHAAKGSNSSSSSRKKHLMEIAEEDEEEQQPTKRQSLIKEKEKDREQLKGSDERPTTTGEPVTLNSDLAASLENSKFSAPTTSEVPTFVGSVEPSPPTENAPRLSSQSSRTEVFTSYSAYSYTSKPKVKLGPRPSLDTTIIRPQTAGNFRPVSSIPAGLKLFGKGSSSSARRRKDSAGSSNAPASPRSEITDFAFSAAIPIPEEPTNKLTLDVPRPATSSGVSTKSGVSTIMSTSMKSAMTPEKARLKKALQLREKKKKKKEAQSPSSPPLTSPEIPDTVSVPVTPDSAVPHGDETDVTADDKASENKADDSGVGIETSTTSTKGDHASEGTQPDSRPLSPVVTSSEAGESTKASSVSESTDQTVVVDEGLGDGSDAKPPAGSGEPDGLVGDHATESSVANEEHEDASTPESKPDTVAPHLSEEIKPDNAEREAEPDSDQSESANTDHELTTGESRICKDAETSSQAGEHEQSGADPRVNAAQSVQVSPIAPQDQALEDQKPETIGTPETSLEDIEAKQAQPDLKTGPNSLSPKIQVPDSATFPDIAEDDTATPIARTNANDSSADQATESESESLLAARVRKSSIAKRKANVEPIKTDLANRGRAASQSDSDLSDDDSLLEELQSATVHEAKPMTVSKTPLTPVFPGRLNSNNGMATATASPPIPAGPFAAPLMAKPQMIRTASNPVRGNLIAPPSDVSQSSARSVSQGAAFLHQVTQQRTADGTLAKKTNMGSSISQRIKALERLSVKPGDAPSQANSRPSSSFFSVKPRAPSRSPSVVDRTTSLSKDTRPSTAHSRDDSPEASRFHRERSGSISSRLSVFEPGNSPGNTPRGRPETVSVTARIIRDSPSASRTPPEYNNPVELKQSALLVDHQRSDAVSPPPEPVEEAVPEKTKSHRRNESKDSETQRSSFNVVKEFIKEHRKSIVSSPSSEGPRSPTRPPSTHQNTTFVGRLSMSSRRSLSKDRDLTASPSVGTDGSVSGDDSKSMTSDKKMSRAGRLMRRLSSFSGPSKGHKHNNAPSTSGTPTVAEEDTEAVQPVKHSAPSIVADLGDVNVQFPDTLLWKRRNMYLDSQGFVVLSALAQQQHQAPKGPATTGVKKYHLSEFKTPYTPDVEIQELPNSVVLDLVEGSAVQVACEDRTGQLHVLEVLRSAHVKHAGN